MSGRPLAVGQYELRFQLADYYRKQGVAVGDPPLLDYVPLICTPWSYSTYRDS